MVSAIIEKITSVYGYTYIIPTICTFGILCNLINLSVLFNRRLKESPYTYLTGLAVSDLLSLFFINTTTFTRGSWFFKTVQVDYWLKKLERQLFLPSANIFSALSVAIIGTLTIERYLFIKFPLKAIGYCSPKIARRIMALLFVCVLCFRFPMYLFFDVKYDFKPDT